mmetsp:Transcript_2479/g.4367  ORF Transcript_2479/g.4367 Transcript_2479/m.4367 type:complete len:399 (+) Transcript_2479:3-1199(+)
MAARFLVIALAFYQATGQEVASCQDCAESGEDASFLQAAHTKRGPHIEASKGNEYPENKNPWARLAKKKRLNHHQHLHEKVVDSTDYRQDAADVYEKVKNLSLEERCPSVKIMTLDEVRGRWVETFAKFLHENKDVGTKDYQAALEDLKADFPGYLDNGKPVIVKGDVPRQLGWNAADHWGPDELSRFLGETTWQRTTFNYPDWIVGLKDRTTLKDYLANHDSKENVFLFASENGCNEDHELKSLVDTMRSQFAPSPEWAYRPDDCEGIIAVDGIGSSHGFHCHDPVWNTQVSGTKHWWLLEPFYGSNVLDPHGYMDWGGAPKLPHSNDIFEFPNACAMLKEVKPPEGAIKCVMQPGEMIILPDSWMHATCGLTEFTIAAGGWLGGTAEEMGKTDESK